MEEFALRTFGLTKTFGSKFAVNHIDLNVRRGDIYGFIGPNGAGKTTAMKVILDLLSPTDGVIELFGQPRTSGSLRHVGSLIESPGLYTNCSAYENMKRFSILCGGTDKDIAFYLRMVGLEMAGDKKVKAYSLGMKQRLGIAIALLGDPELLILDEPVNGLDPMGMKDVRDIIQFINKERGVTFLISSHLLGELEKVANVYGIINQGVLLEELTSEELDSRCGSKISIRCSDPEAARTLVMTQFGIEGVTIEGGKLIIDTDPKASSKINSALVAAGSEISTIEIISRSYEDYLLERMGMLNVGSGVGQYV